jgi:hypothetical protein
VKKHEESSQNVVLKKEEVKPSEISPVRIDDTYGVQLFSKWVGGRKKYDQLPVLDLLGLETWRDHKNRPSNIPIAEVTALIMRGTNGFLDSDYLIVKFKIKSGSTDYGPGMKNR